MRRLALGFTLVEVMVALVVVAILATLGMPAFNGVFERARADTDAGDLIRALNLARLEAINRGVSITVAPDGTGVGWNGDLVVTAGGTPIRKLSGMASGATVSGSGSPAAIVFNNLGALQSPAGGTTFSYSRGSYSKTVSVCATGRVHTGANCQ